MTAVERLAAALAERYRVERLTPTDGTRRQSGHGAWAISGAGLTAQLTPGRCRFAHCHGMRVLSLRQGANLT